jgi:O-acetyl-ADP-ribose deacetylase (regulator of RNase III)
MQGKDFLKHNEIKMFYIRGSLLEATEDYIVHQCNCKTRGYAVGLAKDIFEKFPHADVYRNRQKDDVPGTIKVCGGGNTNERGVIAIFGQVYPGSPKDHSEDRADDREMYFARAFEEISKLSHDSFSIALPKYIGCGLARGDWREYLSILICYAQAYPHIRMVIYSP